MSDATLILNEQTRELKSVTGYIHKMDDSLYVDHPIYLGKFDSLQNYEIGRKEGYEAWMKAREAEEMEKSLEDVQKHL